MLTHHVYPKRRITVIRASGTVSLAEFQRTFDAIRRDPDFSPEANWVLVAMDRGAITPELASELAAKLLILPRPPCQMPKCALVMRGRDVHEALAPFFDVRTSRRIATRAFTS